MRAAEDRIVHDAKIRAHLRSDDSLRRAATGRWGMNVKVLLSSYNYSPEPTGIGPISAVMAEGLAQRGHHMRVLAAHPHYPSPEWGLRVLPRHETRAGISVLRLPLYIGRSRPRDRLIQELSYAMASGFTAPFLGRSDLLVAVSPSFPALQSAMSYARIYGRPWVLWLQDLLPDGAVATGQLGAGRALRLARRFERHAYDSAAKIIVIAESFQRALIDRGVPPGKISLIRNPSSRQIPELATQVPRQSPHRLLLMGNIGHSQMVEEVVTAFVKARPPELRLVVTGAGVMAAKVRSRARPPWVEMRGLVPDDELDALLGSASLGVVTQSPDRPEFNLPSKVSAYMSHGLPIAAIVPPSSECAQLVSTAGAGWVFDSRDMASAVASLQRIVNNADELRHKSSNAAKFAQRVFSPVTFVDAFEADLLEVHRLRNRGA